MLRLSLKAGKAIFLAAAQQFNRDAAQKPLDSATYSAISRLEPSSNLGQKGPFPCLGNVYSLSPRLAVISGSLSDRMCSGMPRTSITSAIVSRRPRPLIRLATRVAKALPGELVDHGQEPNLAAIMGLHLHKIVRPDMIAPLRSCRMQEPSWTTISLLAFVSWVLSDSHGARCVACDPRRQTIRPCSKGW
jgi:hypothetical protein